MFSTVTIVLLVSGCATATISQYNYWPGGKGLYNNYRNRPQQSYPTWRSYDPCDKVYCYPIYCRYGQYTPQGECCPQCTPGIDSNHIIDPRSVKGSFHPCALSVFENKSV
ncbi:hypothetical protein DPMN_079825 [Dreissena polymorpha]|uniref:Uncharacterized protein n=1 Tax=Dreissena polymorpha TaxID=45954 RepID=A0A9D4BQF6_DREPO|nr:hypothetical protein DPMN_079825 [Dreissena polymorpha]